MPYSINQNFVGITAANTVASLCWFLAYPVNAHDRYM